MIEVNWSQKKNCKNISTHPLSRQDTNVISNDINTKKLRKNTQKFINHNNEQAHPPPSSAASSESCFVCMSSCFNVISFTIDSLKNGTVSICDALSDTFRIAFSIFFPFFADVS